MTMALEAFEYKRGSLLVLDQVKLPHKHEYVRVSTVEDGWAVINKMQVRGAPAIGIAALLSLAVELSGLNVASWSLEELQQWSRQKLDHLVTSRPTGVNLRIECDAVRDFIDESINQFHDVRDLKEAILEKCEQLLPRDIRDNKTMAKFGADEILSAVGGMSSAKKKVRILTHCNTGSLATGGYGTALGVIRSLHEQNRLELAYCTETRPYNQGSRLTAYELVYEKIPAKLICDSAVASLMANQEIDAVVVGADRIARNGDTANKIGTYQIAINAKHHNVPFYIAAPTATIDFAALTGKDIPIEDRPGEEITLCKCSAKALIASKGIDCWNPAFDVTPAELIHGIFTEVGVLRAPVDSPENRLKLGL